MTYQNENGSDYQYELFKQKINFIDLVNWFFYETRAWAAWLGLVYVIKAMVTLT